MSNLAPGTIQINDHLVDELNSISEPHVLVKEIFTRFGRRAAIGTSGQRTGCVLMDMAAKSGQSFRVFAVDTLRLHPETYELWDKLEEHYGISIERFTPAPEKLERMIRQHGEFLFFDSREKQEFCCEVRKVEPNSRALETLDVWISGLRKDQSDSREETPRIEVIQKDGRSILKLCPLVDWTEEQVKAYIATHQVPYNPLFDLQSNGAQYTSLGCIICTTPVLPHEPPRAGRWRWFNILDPQDKKECGIHLSYNI